MDEVTLAQVVSAVGLAIALAACAGLRTWLPLFLAGACSRLGLLDLSPSFQVLGSNRALVLLGLATLIEVVADKVPVVDHALDLVSTVLRPAAGSLLAASALGKVSDPVAALVLGVVVGAPVSLVPHAAKTTLRAASTAATAGFANPFLSAIEDVAVVILFALALLVPAAIAIGTGLLAFALLRKRRRQLAPRTA